MRFSLFVALVVATFAVSCFDIVSAKEAVVIKPLAEVNWQNAFTKVKAVNAFEKAGKVRGEAKAAAAAAKLNAQKNWDTVVTKLKAGGQFKPLDPSKKEWQTAFVKVKQAGLLKGATQSQVMKVTEDAAQALTKNPSKWRYVKKALEITLGAVLAALIYVGLKSMFS
ncbi:RxLR effector protein [Phytophthora cinnamomi]|uniref:RxLR effector protein n=1 Tax=Phytophthora cinnamomi TaxID=4785 RepID=UPI0035594878|nr:RxLR effector protein [Phytophthora cinnamomi]